MWLRLFAGVSVLVLSYASSALAESFRLGPIYTDRPGEVSVVVEFESPPRDLPPSYFRLVEGGKALATAQEIKSFKESGRGLALIICVDVSGSMKGDPLADTKEALLSFLGKVSPQDYIALVSFADEDRVESSFGDTREQLAQAISNLHPIGTKTKLWQTLYEVVDIFPDAKKFPEFPKRRRLLVISDGKDEGSKKKIEDVMEQAKSLRIPIDVVGRGKIAPQFADALDGLAWVTGGKSTYANAQFPLMKAIDWIYSSLSETPSLVVYFSYEKGTAGRKIPDASIQLQRPGEEPPSSERILEEIPWSLEISQPTPAPTPAPTSKPSKWPERLFWLLFIVLLAISLAVVIRRRQKVEERVGPSPGSWPEPERLSGRQRDVTVEEGIGLRPTLTASPPEPERPSGRQRDRAAVGDVLPAGERQETKVMSLGAEPRPSEQSGKGDSRRIVGLVITYTWRPEGQLFPIYEGRNFIGRADVSSEAKPRLCDIPIPQDAQMSAEHALILCRQRNYEIIDQETTNGTLVNGELLKANLSAELPNYAKVRTGATEWTFIRIDAPQGGEGLARSGSLPEPTEKTTLRTPTLVR